ncbi:hypothetical protein AB833_04020 [Chromatiales bacterium (ex Bugula neritina AB1)]|nr:hypothetical protein AB833_04020 [Chromatiales bacterium (ex Bugula neritina AB1)]
MFILVLILSPVIYAQEDLLDNDKLASKDETVTICNVQAHAGTKAIIIKVCGQRASKNQCGSNDARWVGWTSSETGGGDAMYGAALTALISKKTVTIRVDESTGCVGAYDGASMLRINE